jgi:N6-adenosine-specific RNA methylase IME4
MPNDLIVNIDDIIVQPNRMRRANGIEDLAASIQQVGLLQAIVLRKDGERYVLVAGLRRLKAVKFLRHGTIRARIVDVDEIDAAIMEIDENLQRAELTALQRAQHITERKHYWISKHQETKHGGAPGNKGKGRGKAPRIKGANLASLINAHNSADGQTAPALSFVKETAKATQSAERTIKRFDQIGKHLCRQAQDLLMGTSLEDRKTDLLALAKVKDNSEQIHIAQLIHDGKATTFLRAKKLLEAERLRIKPPPLPTGPFDVIVVDPPWEYKKRPDDSSKRESIGYATMSIDEIKKLPIKNLANDKAILWLWTTNAHLPDAFNVLKVWGFKYKTLLTWNKVRIGMGDWLRGKTEHCLMCVKGKATVLLTNQTTLISESRRQHSEKPQAFYELVESLCPGAKVGLFARQERKDWLMWGNPYDISLLNEITENASSSPNGKAIARGHYSGGMPHAEKSGY